MLCLGAPLSNTSNCSPTWKLLHPTFLDFMKPSSHRHDGSLTPFLAPLPPLEGGEGGVKVSIPNQGLLLPVTSPNLGAIQVPTQIRLLRTKDARAPGTWSLLLPLPVSLPLSLSLCVT